MVRRERPNKYKINGNCLNRLPSDNGIFLESIEESFFYFIYSYISLGQVVTGSAETGAFLINAGPFCYTRDNSCHFQVSELLF